MTKATLTATIASDRTDSHPIIGTRLVRILEVAGFTNSAGEPEVYRVTYDGLFNDGSLRARVQVQRTNGTFAMLNNNTHGSMVRRVLYALKQEGFEAAYREANAAI